MRCDQFSGLPKDALEFLKRYEVKCPHCKQVMPDTEIIGHYVGMFDNKYPLVRYLFADGGHADEFLQAESWPSGPIFFLGLKVSDGEIFAWKQEEINNA